MLVGPVHGGTLDLIERERVGVRVAVRVGPNPDDHHFGPQAVQGRGGVPVPRQVVTRLVDVDGLKKGSSFPKPLLPLASLGITSQKQPEGPIFDEQPDRVVVLIPTGLPRRWKDVEDRLPKTDPARGGLEQLTARRFDRLKHPPVRLRRRGHAVVQVKARAVPPQHGGQPADVVRVIVGGHDEVQRVDAALLETSHHYRVVSLVPPAGAFSRLPPALAE